MKVAIIYGTPQQCADINWAEVPARQLLGDGIPATHLHLSFLNDANVKAAIAHMAERGVRSLIISSDDQALSVSRLLELHHKNPEICAFRSLNNIHRPINVVEIDKYLREVEHKCIHLVYSPREGETHHNAGTLYSVGIVGARA